MARTGRPKAELVLTDEERSVLERLVRRHHSAQALALRARVVLACASGKTSTAVAAELRVNEATVGKWPAFRRAASGRALRRAPAGRDADGDRRQDRSRHRQDP